MSKLMQNKFGY